MKKIIIFMLAVSGLQMSALEHRFYAVEPDGGTGEDIECSIVSDTAGVVETLTVTMRNNRHTPFQPVKAGVKLGIDTYMDAYPAWNDKYFPTFMMCEPMHCYGYLQSPSGKVKAVVSDSPVASWSLDYNLGYQEPAPHWFYGHRIKALNLDLLAALPLPPHHPQDSWQLAPDEERTWRICLVDLEGIDSFEQAVNAAGGVPTLKMERTSCAPGEYVTIEVYGHAPKLSVGGTVVSLRRCAGGNLWRGRYVASEPGIVSLTVADGAYTVHGTVNVRYLWCKTMELARIGALEHKQKATSHVESWYGFHTAFLAARYFPDAAIDSLLDRRFDLVFGNVFDLNTGKAYKYGWRMQNVASTIGMLADRYEAYGNTADLDRAALLADRMVADVQRADGAYMNGHTDYSSVIYPAKSLLELADAEYAAGRRKAAARHEASARRAVDRLVAMDGDFNTEGEITYEDGMVSCSALQMGAMALRCKKAKDRRRYTEAMLKLLDGHDCLTQLRVPDGRRRGGTMRFWESQYDVHMQPNMISSPHGWSAWRAYATYYAYLLTGEERWLSETFDAASAFASLIDHETGELRWAFVIDPQVHARQICEPDSTHTADMPSYGCPHPDMYISRDYTLGEQYVPMVAGWQTMVSSDNDVHEVFKFIAEAVLTNAFVIERADGSIGAYNCRAERSADTLVVSPLEEQIVNLHANVRRGTKVQFPGSINHILQ